MKTFKNIHFKKRDYEATNIVYCEANYAPNENWIEVDPSDNNLTHLYTENGVKYFGYL